MCVCVRMIVCARAGIIERSGSQMRSRKFESSRDAVDDQFQHTLDVLAGKRMGLLNLQAQELSIDMLNYVI